MATKLTGHDFVVPNQSAPDWLNAEMPDSMDIRASSVYQSLDAEMDFIGSDTGTQSHGSAKTQPRKLRFLTD